MPKIFESLEDRFPEIAARYNHDLNARSLSTIAPFSGYRAWWDCEKNHSWFAAASSVSNGQGCAVCRGMQIAIGFNDLASCFPDIALDWDYAKNVKTPKTIAQGTHEKAWWLCKAENHSWETQVFARTNGGNNCPYCSGKKILAGYNDFATLHPDLLKEWDYAQNIFYPTMIGGKSHAEIRWLCPQYGHSYPALVKSRTRRGDGCPYCSNMKILVGFNDLATTHPLFEGEWDYSKNTILPTTITAGYSKPINWICSIGHTWHVSPNSRKFSNTRCPKCNKTGTSLIENTFRERLSLLDTVLSMSSEPVKIKCKDGSVISVDGLGVTSSGRKFIFEYDGSYWHGATSPAKDILLKDTTKTKKLLLEGFLIIRIRENTLPFIKVESANLFQTAYAYKELSKATENIADTTALIEAYLKAFS